MDSHEKLLLIIFFRDWKQTMIDDGYHVPEKCPERKICEEVGSTNYCDFCNSLLDKKFKDLHGHDKKNFLAMVGLGK
jgi:hypothetical protein